MSRETIPRILKVAFFGDSSTQQDVIAHAVSMLWKGSFASPVMVHGINPDSKIRALIDSYHPVNGRDTKIVYHEHAIRGLVKSQNTMYETDYVRHNYPMILKTIAMESDEYEEILITAYNLHSAYTVKYLWDEGFMIFGIHMSLPLRITAFRASSKHTEEMQDMEIMEMLRPLEYTDNLPPQDNDTIFSLDINGDLNADNKILRKVAAKVYAHIIA